MKTRQVLSLLQRFESRNVTYVDPEGGWPIVWQRARGVHVWDADGRKYLDLTAAFGVAAAGHTNPRVVRAGHKQMATLLHAMGDVHPHALKAQLAQELSRLTFERWPGRRTGKTIFCNSGFEAVEAALKTARLATGKRGVIAFEGGYHGLGYGALNATHREHFRAAFKNQLGGFATFVPFPAVDGAHNTAAVGRAVGALLKSGDFGAVLVEPIQARGGINVPPSDFLGRLSALCKRHRALLVFDEIYTGFGRTGRWFACEHGGVTPDLICLGKALTGGFPLSACVGRADLMDAAWPPSNGEAIHTSTFLGHPVGCAMALANIAEIRAARLPARSAAMGERFQRELRAKLGNIAGVTDIRGIGLIIGVELRDENGAPDTARSLRVIKEMLARGFILLPEGEHANIISFTPPLTISERDVARTVTMLREILVGSS